MSLSDIGISFEILGFIFLILHQLPIIKRLRKRDRTKGFYDALFPVGIAIVIFGLILQFSFLSQDNELKSNQELVDNGDFLFEKQSYSNSEYKSIPEIVSVLEKRLPNLLNQDFILPYDVYIKFQHCDNAGAYYSPSEKSVVYCYEMLEDSFDLVREATNSTSLNDFEKGSMVTGITFFFLYHELAHALIDSYDLQVLGKEEDAADFFSILIIFSILEDLESPSYALSGPMALFAQQSEIYTYTSDLKFWDSHSLDDQRLYFILCLLYEKYGSGVFPEGFEGSKTHERLKECKLGIDDISKSWQNSLKPYMKHDSYFHSKFE